MAWAMRIDLPGLALDAVSVAGLETCIEVPSWKLALDIGRCPPTASRWPTVLFTHAHLDHMGGVANHCATRSMTGMSPPHYAMPYKNVQAFGELLDVWRKLDGSGLPCTFQGVRPGEEVPLGRGRVARAFQAYHRVTAVGWALIEKRKKLLPELVGLPGKELGARRAKGLPIDSVTEHCEMVFCGDTTIEVVEREELVRTARVLVIEATFLDDRVGVERTRKSGHIHLDEIIERADLFENEWIVLNHPSIRYSAAEVTAICKRRLPASLFERVVPMVPGPPWSQHTP